MIIGYNIKVLSSMSFHNPDTGEDDIYPDVTDLIIVSKIEDAAPIINALSQVKTVHTVEVKSASHPDLLD